jgi:hypothetical protein
MCHMPAATKLGFDLFNVHEFSRSTCDPQREQGAWGAGFKAPCSVDQLRGEQLAPCITGVMRKYSNQCGSVWRGTP